MKTSILNAKSIYKLLSAMMLSLVVAGGLVSCDDGDYWNPAPPYGWNDTFRDYRLNGCWELIQANGRPVDGYAVNYLDFYGNGRGRFYYYSDGVQEVENMAYWCQYGNNGYRQMNIQYEYSAPSTVNYWFTDGDSRLWMSWGTGSGVVTYVYRLSTLPGW